MVNASEDKYVKRSNHMENTNSEKYSRGRRGAPAKGVGRETGARVQIPLSPLEHFQKTLKKLFKNKLKKCLTKFERNDIL